MPLEIIFKGKRKLRDEKEEDSQEKEFWIGNEEGIIKTLKSKMLEAVFKIDNVEQELKEVECYINRAKAKKKTKKRQRSGDSCLNGKKKNGKKKAQNCKIRKRKPVGMSV